MIKHNADNIISTLEYIRNKTKLLEENPHKNSIDDVYLVFLNKRFNNISQKLKKNFPDIHEAYFAMGK